MENIRNLKTKRILIYQINYGGYNYITLLKKTYSIHRLVACAFIENNDNKPTVNHINKIPNNNYYRNFRKKYIELKRKILQQESTIEMFKGYYEHKYKSLYDYNKLKEDKKLLHKEFYVVAKLMKLNFKC
jgi:hypothetical protein